MKQRFDLQAMDNAATEAENELTEMDEEKIKPVANWIEKHYRKAGYKRLCRILKQYADKEEK